MQHIAAFFVQVMQAQQQQPPKAQVNDGQASAAAAAAAAAAAPPMISMAKSKPIKASKNQNTTSSSRRDRLAKKTGETRCRKVLERITKMEWPTVRPEWLVNPLTGRKLEADMMCEGMKMCGEFQGVQHRKYQPGIIHKTREDFDKAQRLDIFKAAEIRKHGYKLFYIHDTEWRELDSDDPVVLEKFLWQKMAFAQ